MQRDQSQRPAVPAEGAVSLCERAYALRAAFTSFGRTIAPASNRSQMHDVHGQRRRRQSGMVGRSLD